MNLPPGWKQGHMRYYPKQKEVHFKDISKDEIVPKFLKYLLEYNGIPSDVICYFKGGGIIDMKEVK